MANETAMICHDARSLHCCYSCFHQEQLLLAQVRHVCLVPDHRFPGSRSIHSRLLATSRQSIAGFYSIFWQISLPALHQHHIAPRAQICHTRYSSRSPRNLREIQPASRDTVIGYNQQPNPSSTQTNDRQSEMIIQQMHQQRGVKSEPCPSAMITVNQQGVKWKFCAISTTLRTTRDWRNAQPLLEYITRDTVLCTRHCTMALPHCVALAHRHASRPNCERPSRLRCWRLLLTIQVGAAIVEHAHALPLHASASFRRPGLPGPRARAVAKHGCEERLCRVPP